MTVKNPSQVSTEYYQFINEFTQTAFESDKLLGKFYTNSDIATSLMHVLCQFYKNEVIPLELRIIDPFCGDGRLIVSFLSELQKVKGLKFERLFISIWDIDDYAVKTAKNEITKYCDLFGYKYEIDARQVDAFIEFDLYRGNYDICLTNPPWSLLKPQKLFSKNNNDESLMEYRLAIGQYASYIEKAFMISQPSSKFGKWGTNLARCGTEVALRLIKANGFCGIVSPASLLNDQVSGNLRNWIFENYRVINVSYYPAELKLFESADISSITMVVKKECRQQSFDFRIYNTTDSYEEERIEGVSFEYISRTGFCIPLKTGLKSIPIRLHLEQFPTTDSFCKEVGLHFARELDETRIKEKLLPVGRIEFAKGYMVDRYSFTSNQVFINEELVNPPVSTFLNKIVWRDVSRDSQARRIKATLLHPGFICGNSLGIIYGNDTSLQYLKMLLAIMNSLVYEYQARSMLVSNHVSVGIVKKIRVPRIGVNMNIIELVNKQLEGQDVEDAIEIAVAQLYNLSVDEYTVIVDSFKMEEERRRKIIQLYRKKCAWGTTDL